MRKRLRKKKRKMFLFNEGLRVTMRPRLNLEPVTVCAAVDLYYGNVRYLTKDDFEMDEEGLLHIKSEVYKSLTMAFYPIVHTNIDSWQIW
jgi:hypothetical protein